jgi:hypothetical protein
MSAEGAGWRTRVTPRARGPALPWLLPPIANLIQIGAGVTRVSSRPRGRGTARFAQVTVETTAPSMTDWFPTGRCFGTLSENLVGYLPSVNRELSVSPR